MKREKQLLRNTLILSIGTFLPRVTSFITLPIYTNPNYLSDAEIGIYDLVVTILIGLVVPVITLQIDQAVFRFLLDSNGHEQRKRTITTSYVFVFLTTIIGCIITYYGFSLLGYDYGYLKFYIVAYLFIESIILVTRQVIRGLGYNKIFSISSIIATITNLVLIFPFLIGFGWGIEGLMISLILADVASITYLLFSVRIQHYFSFKSYEKDTLLQLFKYSFPLIPNNISWWVVSAADRIIITAVLGEGMTGVYSVSNKIPTILNMFMTTFNLAWQESAIRSHQDEDSKRYYGATFRNIFNIASAGMLLLIAGTPILFKILVNENLHEAIYQVPILIIGTYFSCFATFYGGIYIALKKSSKVGISSLYAAIINTIINVLFIRALGLYAASISTAIAYFVFMMYRAFDIQKICRLKYNFKVICLVIIFLAIDCFLFYQGGTILMLVNIALMTLVSYILNFKLVNKTLKKFLKKR